jgi:hypothetical protein
MPERNFKRVSLISINLYLMLASSSALVPLPRFSNVLLTSLIRYEHTFTWLIFQNLNDILMSAATRRIMILETLSPGTRDQSHSHNDIRRKLMPGTGGWFFEKFQGWLGQPPAKAKPGLLCMGNRKFCYISIF